MPVGSFAWIAAVLGRLAFVGAGLALVIALRRKDWAGRANSILSSAVLMALTVRYVVPLPQLVDELVATASFVVVLVLLWRKTRGHGV